MRSLLLLSLLTLTTLGCNKEVTEPVLQPLTATVIVTAANRFVDDVTAIRVGGTVTWQFQATHTVTFTPKTGAPNNIPESQAGTNIQRTFPTAGQFEYSCDLHNEIGSINVIAP